MEIPAWQHCLASFDITQALRLPMLASFPAAM